MNSKELDSILKVLKKHGVEEYKEGETQIKISPVAFLPKTKKGFADAVTKDDLYYSSDKLKIINKPKQ